MTGYKNKEDASPDHFHLTLLPRLQKIFVFNVSTINMYINIFFNILIYIQYYIFVSAINILSFGILAINIYLENLTLGGLESHHHHLTGV